MARNKRIGLRGIIAIGTFEIGMEYLLFWLSSLYGLIWMDERRRRFLRFLEIDKCENTDNIVAPLVTRLAKDSSKAILHVLDVHNINRDVSIPAL